MTPSTAIYKIADHDPRELHRGDVLTRRLDRSLWEVRAFRMGLVYLRSWHGSDTLIVVRRRLRCPAWRVSLRFLV